MRKEHREHLRKLALRLYFKLDEEQIDRLVIEFDDIVKEFDNYSQIDTSNIEFSDTTLVEKNFLLREDVVVECLNPKDHLQNATEIHEGQVVVK